MKLPTLHKQPPAVTPFAVARHLPQDNPTLGKRPTWKPEPWLPARPGADDHKQYKSKGL
jgi:hypothetical protein